MCAYGRAATMEHQRLGHGRGIDPDAARRAAVGELVEIASCCDWGDLPMQWHSPIAVGRDGWAPDRLNGFSLAQRSARADWNRSMDGLDWIPPDSDPHQPIAWLLANEQTTDRDVLVPADAVVIGRKEFGGADAVSVADTNGCAAAPTLDAARLSALFELVERDATGLWWYGRQPCHVVTPETDERYHAIAQHLHERARQILVLDITSDIRIPTLVAIAADLDGSHLIMGFGCRLSRHDALQVALIELMQIELKLAMAREEDLELPDLEPWFQEVGMIDVPSGPGSGADDQSLMRDQEESRLPVARVHDATCGEGRKGFELKILNKKDLRYARFPSSPL